MKHLFFDLDGTLVDSSPGILSCFTKTFTHLGLVTPDLDTMKTFIGPPLEHSFAPFGTSEFVDKAVEIYRLYYKEDGVYQAQLYTGVKELLTELKHAGFVVALATSKDEKMAHEMLRHLGILDLFDGVFGSLGKDTKADVLARGIAGLNSPTDETFMIGDTHFDMMGGKTLGLRTIGVTWGFGSPQSLLDSGADYLAYTPQDIRKHLGNC